MEEEVLIEIQSGGSFSIFVGLADSVLEIKQKIQGFLGIPVARQTLLFHNVVLDDESTIYDELALDARLTLVIEFAVPPPPPRPPLPPPSSSSNILKIKVKTLNGATVTVKMSPSKKVEKLREKIESADNFPLPGNGYFFIHKGVVMFDDLTFDWHGVSSGDTIEVFPGSVENLPEK